MLLFGFTYDSLYIQPNPSHIVKEQNYFNIIIYNNKIKYLNYFNKYKKF